MIWGTPTPATTRVVQIDAGPDADLHGVRAGVAERLGGLLRGDVAGDDLHVESLLDLAHRVDDRLRMAVGGVDDERVDLLVDERRRALERVRADADRSRDAQPTLLVLGRERVLDLLLDVLDRDQALQVAVLVDDGKLLDAVAGEDCFRLVERRADRHGDEALARHQVRDRLLRIGLEAQIAVRQDADERPVSSVIGTPEMW